MRGATAALPRTSRPPIRKTGTITNIIHHECYCLTRYDERTPDVDADDIGVVFETPRHRQTVSVRDVSVLYMRLIT
jgi:hypothetical protein